MKEQDQDLDLNAEFIAELASLHAFKVTPNGEFLVGSRVMSADAFTGFVTEISPLLKLLPSDPKERERLLRRIIFINTDLF